MNKIKNILFGALTLLSSAAMAQNSTCANMLPICTDAGLSFTAQSGVSNTEPSNDYDCLYSQPNPSWYYLEISTAGDIVMSLSAPSDIDFIIYGPYADLAAAQSDCGTFTASDVVDCSYSSTSNETPEITGAQVGEVYVMLITNYANTVQDITLTQTGGTGATDCSIVTACVSNPGTFVRKKNGVSTALPLYLCDGDSFSIESNDDYILPNDTIAAPVGDGIYSAQLMWLVYDAVPTTADPTADPGFTGTIIPSEDLSGTNSATDPIFTALGGVCGTYYFVPVAGDDGIGGNNNVSNGTNDNGGVTWDKNDNGCYELGTAIEVTFACEIQTTPVVNCGTSLGNAMDIDISGGSGNYTVYNQGDGNIVSTTVINGGTAQITDLTNNQSWEIEVEDAQGCTTTASGIFSAPTIASVTVNPANTCPDASTGDVSVVLGSSGTSPYTVTMNSTVTAGSPYVYSDIAGTAVTTVVADANGCTFDSTTTITASGHYIDVTIVNQTDELCYGDGNGSATISAVPTPSGTVTQIDWTDPIGNTSTGGATNTTQTGMQTGNWIVTITDDTGCEVNVGVTIDGPQDLGLSVSDFSNVTCFDGNDGDISLESNGGVGTVTYSWNTNNPVTPTNPNATTANNLTAGTYIAYVTDANGCSDSIEVEITQPDEITAWYTIKDVLCYGDSTGSIIIDSVTNNAGNVDYIWNLGLGFVNPATTDNIAANLPAGTYEFKIKDENDCENQYEVEITQYDSLYWDELGFDYAICRNQVPFDNGQGQVFAAAARGGNGSGGSNFTYEWTEVSTGNTTTNTTWGNRNPGYYTVIAIDDYGCVLTETIYLDSISPIAAFSATSPQFTSDYVGTAQVDVTFTNESMNYAFSEDPNADTTFIWSFFPAAGGDTTIIETNSVDQTVGYSYTSEDLYTVCLTVIENLNGCEDSTCINIQIFDQPSLTAPNVFTPDGDGINDLFYFPNAAIVEFSCTVFDRWGKLVFEFDDINQTWDGSNMNNGKICSDGVYFYMYEGTSSNGTEYKGQGNVHLINKE